MTMSLYTRACEHIPGGVNSPVRAFRSVGGEPVFISHAKGAYLYDVNNKAYVDYVGSWGPMITGHAHPEIISAVEKAIQNGLSFGAPTEMEIEMAELICRLMPSIEMVRMTSSGTEAAMSAVRLARGFTGKNKVVKFRGAYHGHSDSLLAPDAAGVPASAAAHTLIADYNDLTAVERLFQQYPQDIAAIIVEPVAGNMNCVLPQDGFLAGLRQLTEHYNSLLIFDEVITGFRVALGGAQAHYGIQPDLTVLGKIIGGGMPVGAFGGRKDIMSAIAPLGSVYQAGTLSGNPIAMTAGLAALKIIQQDGFYENLSINTKYLLENIKNIAQKYHIGLYTSQLGSLFGLFFTDQESIKNLTDVNQCNAEKYKLFFHGMLKEGIYFAPSAFEAGFLSIAHQEKEIAQTLAAAEKVFKQFSA